MKSVRLYTRTSSGACNGQKKKEKTGTHKQEETKDTRKVGKSEKLLI